MAVANTVHVPEERRFPNLEILSVAPLLAKAIRYIHSGESVSSLFEAQDEKG
jgi:ribose-phosphate pyrophosphokinase